MSSPATPADTAKESRGTTTDPHKCRSGRERDDVGQATSMRPPYAYTVTREGGQKRGNNHRYKRSMERRSGHGTHGRYRRGRAVDVGIQLARAQKVLYQQDTLARDDLALQQAALEHDLAEQHSASAADIARIQARSRQETARLTGGADPKGLRAVTRLWAGLSQVGRQAQERSQVRARSRASSPLNAPSRTSSLVATPRWRGVSKAPATSSRASKPWPTPPSWPMPSQNLRS